MARAIRLAHQAWQQDPKLANVEAWSGGVSGSLRRGDCSPAFMQARKSKSRRGRNPPAPSSVSEEF